MGRKDRKKSCVNKPRPRHWFPPSVRSPRGEERDLRPVIDFLPLLDLSIVGSLFNLAINWESSSRMSCSIFFLSGWGICFMMHCVLNTSNLVKWLLRGLRRSSGGLWYRRDQDSLAGVEEASAGKQEKVCGYHRGWTGVEVAGERNRPHWGSVHYLPQSEDGVLNWNVFEGICIWTSRY